MILYWKSKQGHQDILELILYWKNKAETPRYSGTEGLCITGITKYKLGH